MQPHEMIDVDEEDFMNQPVPASDPVDGGSELDPESEHEEEELDAAFDREGSASSYDSEASNERECLRDWLGLIPVR